MPGLSGRGGYEEGRARRTPPPEPHTEHGANIRGPVESGGYSQPYYGGGGRISYSPPPGSYPSYAVSGGGDQTPRGYVGKGPSGAQVFHTYGAWQAITQQRAAQAQAQARAKASQKALAAFGGLAGAIQQALGKAPGAGAPAGAHADYQRGVGLFGGLLKALQSPQQAAQAGRALSTGVTVARGLGQSIGTGMAVNRANLGVPSGLASVPGDLLGNLRRAVSDTPGVLSRLGGGIANPTGPLGARGDVRPGPSDIAALGKAISYPTGPLGQRQEQRFGPDRPAAIAQMGADVGGLIRQAAGSNRAVSAGAYPLNGRLLPHDVRTAQTGGVSAATSIAADVPNWYAGMPSVLYKAVTDPAGLAKDAWQTDPILSSFRTGSLAPLAKGLSEHPILTAAELRGGFAAAHRLTGTAGRAAGLARPGSISQMGNAFSTAPEPTAITTNALRGRGMPDKGRPVLTTERTFSRSPGVNYLQRRAEVGRAPGQAVARLAGKTDLRTGKTSGGGWVAAASRMRKAGVPEPTIRARVRLMRGQAKRIDFLEDKRIVSERMGRNATGRVAAGQGGNRILTSSLIEDAHVRGALKRTELAGQILNDHVRPGHIAQDLQERLAKLAAESRHLPDGELTQDNLRERALIAKALGQPKLATATSDVVRAAKIVPSKDLKLLDTPYKGEQVHPELGVKVSRAFRALEPHAAYIRDVIEPEMEKQGLLPEWRRKAAYVPGLVSHLHARAGTAADRYRTTAGEHLHALREHSRDLEEHAGSMIAAHRKAAGAAEEAVKTAIDEAERAKAADRPGLTGRRTVMTEKGPVRAGRGPQDATLRLEPGKIAKKAAEKAPRTPAEAGEAVRATSGAAKEAHAKANKIPHQGGAKRDQEQRSDTAVAVRQFEQAIRAVRTHLRNAASAYARDDAPAVTRHRELAREAEKRAKTATRNLSPRVAQRVRDAIAREHAAEQAAIEARQAATAARLAHDLHGKGMKDAGIREHRIPWMVIPDVAHGARAEAIDHQIADLQKLRSEHGEMARQRVSEATKRDYMSRANDAQKKIAALREERAALPDHSQPIESEAQARELLQRAGAHLESTGHVGLRGDTTSTGAMHGGTQDVRQRFLAGQQRTGEATRFGLADLSHEAVVEDLHRKRVRVEYAKAQAELMQGGVLHEEPFTNLAAAKAHLQSMIGETVRDESGQAISYVPHEGMPDLVVRDVAPFTRRADEILRRNTAIGLKASAQDVSDQLNAALHDTLNQEPSGTSGAGRYVIMPKDFIDQLGKHGRQAGGSDFFKSWQAIQQQFRKTVLLTSMKWLAGNGIEMIFRLAFHGIGPKALVTGHRLQAAGKRVLGEAGWNDVRAGTTGEGAHFGFALERGQRYRGPEVMSNDLFKGMARIAQGVRHGKVNPIAALGQVWDLWSKAFGGLNTFIEHQGDLAIMGAQATRDVRDFNKNVLAAIHVGRGALEDTARGLTGTARQERYARRIDQVRGQYSRFTPGQRRALEIAPFFPWYLNALRFFAAQAPLVGKTPVRTAAMIAAYNGQRDQLAKQGHTLEPIGFKGKSFLAVGTSDVPGGHVFTGRFLPYGALDTSALPGLILPEVTGAIGGAGGQDFTGKPIDPGDHPVGIADLMGVSLNSFIESMIPGIAILRRMQEGGGTSAQTSTVLSPKVKVPGTKAPQTAPAAFSGGFNIGGLLSGGEKVFNPFHLIPQAAPGGSGTGGYSGNPRIAALEKRVEAIQKKQGGGGASGGYSGNPRIQQLEKRLEHKIGSGTPTGSASQPVAYRTRGDQLPQSISDPRGGYTVQRSDQRVKGDIPAAEQRRMFMAQNEARRSKTAQLWDRMTPAERANRERNYAWQQAQAQARRHFPKRPAGQTDRGGRIYA